MTSPLTDVLVVGAGPTGLSLATALLARGLRVAVVDAHAEGANTSRAAVVHARTLEVLEKLGISDRLIAKGLKVERFDVRDRDRLLMTIRFDDLPTAYPYTLMISQAVTESVLLDRMIAFGGEVLRPREVVGVTQDAQRATAKLGDGTELSARYLVGADGMHSVVREFAGIGFTGGNYEETFVLADVILRGGLPDDEGTLFFSPAGLLVAVPLPGGEHRLVATANPADAPENPSMAYLQALLVERGPQRERAVIKDVVWASRFHVQHRLASTYRAGRILLAGDAAHVHSPAGGQGMNTGIQDAMALADVLAMTLAGAGEAALDRYADTRRPIAERVVTMTDRLTRVGTARRALRPLRNAALRPLAASRRFRRAVAYQLSGLAYR